MTVLPSKAQLFRQFTRTAPMVTIYTVQVWKPTFEDGEILREAGFKPYDSGNEDLENTMAFYTTDPEAAFRVTTPEQWEATRSFELRALMVIEKPEGMRDDDFAVWADKEIDRRMTSDDD